MSLAGNLTSSASQLAVNIVGFGTVTASLHRADSNYIGKVLNTDPSQFHDKQHNLFATYDYANKTSSHNLYSLVQIPGAENWTDDYKSAETPKVISQPFNSVEYELFSVKLKAAGDSSNTLVKISIRDIKKPVNASVYSYGTFTLVVRDYYDNDRAPRILESFSGLTLDPNSPNYVCRRIGDSYKEWNPSTKKFDEFGEYQNKSKYIYVVPSLDLRNENVPEAALPYGFDGYFSLTNEAVGGHGSFPADG
jgi:hypothetical protein